jgi:hypothetical protein
MCQASLAAIEPDLSIRCRRGEPWKSSGIASDCSSSEQMRPRIEELAVRARIEAQIDLGVWTPGAQPMLDGLSAAAVATDRASPPSGWL